SLACLHRALLAIFYPAVDATIITTALPTITRVIGGGHDYVWAANSFLYASTVPQPFFGQVSNVFGQRNPMLAAVALFASGSGIAGTATSLAMLIAARTIQGLGIGVLYVLSDIIICDMAVKGTSPLTPGVYFLPFALVIILFGGLTGLFMSKTGLYIPLQWLSFTLSAIGVGLFMLDENSSQAT
ncbi:putative MFS-type transporter YusP, partial [Madurella mycetomatis]